MASLQLPPCRSGTLWNQLRRKLVARFGIRQTFWVDRLSPFRFQAENVHELFRTLDYGGELESLAAFLFLLEPDDVVWDVGASIGMFAVHAAARTRRVVAFEPDPAVRRRLGENVALNGLSDRVQLEAAALGDEAGEFDLHSDGIAGNAPSLKSFGVHSRTVKVQVATADSLIARGLPSPTVLKLDIEGAEIVALRGARGLLTSTRAPRLIFMEVHPKFLPSYHATPEDVIALLRTAGYRTLSAGTVHDQIHVVGTRAES